MSYATILFIKGTDNHTVCPLNKQTKTGAKGSK